MTKYSNKSLLVDENKIAKSSGANLTCHYKQMSEVGRAIKGKELGKAMSYLRRVLVKKDVIPYMIHKGGKGRHAQAKNHKTGGSGWPSKPTQMMLKLLENLGNNASAKQLESTEKMVLGHVQVQRAPKSRRRTFRAHGRMGPYVRSPCHVELILAAPKAKTVAKTPSTAITSNKQQVGSDGNVPVGGGVE